MVDYNSLSNPEDITMSQNTGRRQMTNMWKEDFQDLSLFCHESVEQSNFTKSISIGRENSTVPDDELNTPDIGVGNDEFVIDSWTWPQPESLDDLNLWDDNTLLKRGSDYNGDGSMLDAETFGELPEETNQKCINIDAILGDDSSLQKDQSSVVNNKTVDKMYAPDEIIVQDEYGIYEEQVVGQNIEFSSVANIQTCGEIEVNHNEETILPDSISENFSSVSQPEIMEMNEMETYKNLDHISENFSTVSLPENVEVKEIEPLKNLGNLAVVSKTQTMRTALHLPLTMETTADVLNTPEVLARLESQPEFDLLSFVLEDNLGPGPSTSCGSSNAHAAPSSNLEVIGKIVKKEPDMEISLEENACEVSAHSSGGPVQPDEHYLVVAPTDKSSEICLVLKKTPPSKKNKSSLKRESECCKKKIVKYLVKDEVSSDEDNFDDDDDDNDYEPPKKVRRNSRSKRTKSECSKYRELRDRNNEASRKSRQNRKAREEETKSQLATLESENQRLKIRAEELEKLVDTLRKALLNAMVKGKD